MLKKPAKTPSHVLIIGSDLAGVTTALRLLRRGFSVTILCPPQNETDGPLSITPPVSSSLEHETVPATHFDEPWPFVLQGFQQATLSLLHEMGSPHIPPRRSHIPLNFVCPSGRIMRFPVFPLPAPLHSLFGLLTFQGLPLKARMHFLNYVEKLWEEITSLPLGLAQQTADSWLAKAGQPPLALQQVWNPLCRFLLGDHLAKTSADNFTSALARSFLSKRRHAYITLPSETLRESLLTPLWTQVWNHGAVIRVDTRPTSIHVSDDHITGIQMQDGGLLQADWYVAALRPLTLTALLPERVLAKSAYFYHVNQLLDIPALTLHIRVPQDRIPSRLFLSNGTFHWLTFRNETKRKTGLISCVATGNPRLLDQSDQELLVCARDEIHQAFPQQHSLSSVEKLEYRVFRQPRAFLTPSPEITGYRPHQQSPLSNLVLAGDWTDTGLPAGIESAIVSGNRCSECILAKDTRLHIDNANDGP